MTPHTQESPVEIGAWAGPESNGYEKLPHNYNTSADDAIDLLRAAQAVVFGMMQAVDRLAAHIARVAR